MKTSTKNFETVNAKGTVKNFTVTAKRGYEDVVKCDSEDGLDIHTKEVIDSTEIVCKVNGQTIKSGSWDIITNIPAKYAKVGIVAIFAKKVALFKDEYSKLMDAVNESINEAETDASWLQHVENVKAADKAEREYEAQNEMMRKVMDF